MSSSVVPHLSCLKNMSRSEEEYPKPIKQCSFKLLFMGSSGDSWDFFFRSTFEYVDNADDCTYYLTSSKHF